MIYVLLSKGITHKISNHIVIEYVNENIKFNNFNYRLVFCDSHIVESKIDYITSEDILLWEPMLAHNNLDLLKSFPNSIVVLEKPTVYLQKVSKFNPINENLAVNHGFYLVYLKPEESDVTNEEWKMVVKDEMFLMTHERLVQLINRDNGNIKTENKIEKEDVFEDIANFTREQINFSK